MLQLRNHPRMAWHGFSNWPPRWDGATAIPAPVGELGVLTGVQCVGPDPEGPAHLVLTMAYQGQAHTGVLYCDDPTFLSLVHARLQQCLGQSVQGIGSGEL